MMNKLSNEIFSRFPEAFTPEDIENNENLPYLVVSDLVSWLESQGEGELTKELIERVVKFNLWCLDQPPGDTAADDIYTIIVVSLYEKLISSNRIRSLIKHLVPLSELLNNKEYWLNWVSSKQFRLAVECYTDKKT